MSHGSPRLLSGDLSDVRSHVEAWKTCDYSSELSDALAGRLDHEYRRWIVLTMLREEDVPLVLDHAEKSGQDEGVSDWLWHSGLFGHARRRLGKLDSTEHQYDETAERAAQWGLWGDSAAARGLREQILWVS
ncbi:MAG: hypothetical protein QGI09_10800, partial [Dehalococcoidia bacterium]|nr:hypothetical protein [Dehalococcoidia bacterium]